MFRLIFPKPVTFTERTCLFHCCAFKWVLAKRPYLEEEHTITPDITGRAELVVLDRLQYKEGLFSHKNPQIEEKKFVKNILADIYMFSYL